MFFIYIKPAGSAFTGIKKRLSLSFFVRKSIFQIFITFFTNTTKDISMFLYQIGFKILNMLTRFSCHFALM